MYPKQIHKMLAAVLICLMSTAVSYARIYVVCAGIDAYPGSAKLHNCVADADSIKYIYDHQKGSQTTILRDRQATKNNILAQLNSVFAEAGPDDLVVFFFSGHGYPGGFVAIDGNLPYSSIRSAFSNSRARHKMIFADACFSGKMRTSRQSSRQQSEIKNAEVLLFLSSRSNETSLVSSRMTNGYFTFALKRALRGAADKNRDRIITAKELFTFVSQNVKNSTHGQQHPVMWGKFDDNMPVVKW